MSEEKKLVIAETLVTIAIWFDSGCPKETALPKLRKLSYKGELPIDMEVMATRLNDKYGRYLDDYGRDLIEFIRTEKDKRILSKALYAFLFYLGYNESTLAKILWRIYTGASSEGKYRQTQEYKKKREYKCIFGLIENYNDLLIKLESGDTYMREHLSKKETQC